MSRSDEKYTDDFIEVRSTDMAVLLHREDEGDAQWVPYSQIDKIVRSKTSKAVNVTMSAWIAKQKSFID